MNKRLVEPKESLVPHCKIIHYDDAAHWIQHDIPNEVNQQLRNWFVE